MFDNIGSKIKTLAKVCCLLGVICFLITAIVMFASASVGLGFAFLFFGPLFSWISSFVLYGFGELIETNCEIAQNTRTNFQKSKTSINITNESPDTFVSPTTKSKFQLTKYSWTGDCDICGQKNVMVSKIKIIDNSGTSYKNACEQCQEKS